MSSNYIWLSHGPGAHLYKIALDGTTVLHDFSLGLGAGISTFVGRLDKIIACHTAAGAENNLHTVDIVAETFTSVDCNEDNFGGGLPPSRAYADGAIWFTTNHPTGHIRKVDPTTGTTVASILSGGYTNLLSVGGYIYASGTTSLGSIKKIDPVTVAVIGSIPTEAGYLETDGTFLYALNIAAGGAGTLRKIDLNTFTVVNTATAIGTTSPYAAMAIIPGNGLFVVFPTNPGTLSKYSLTDLSLIGSITLTGTRTDADFPYMAADPTNSAVYVTSRDASSGNYYLRSYHADLSGQRSTMTIGSTGGGNAATSLMYYDVPGPSSNVNPPGIGTGYAAGTPKINLRVNPVAGASSEAFGYTYSYPQGPISIDLPVVQQQPYEFDDEYHIEQRQLTLGGNIAVLFGHLASSEGHEDLRALTYVYGPFSQYARPTVYQQTELFKLGIYVEREKCNVYKPQTLKFLPEEFAIKDYNDDLKDYLQVVAISMDEFYCFIQEFTDIFDPDKCEIKYLPYLAKLINWPLNTRGFDSDVASVKEASVSRARKQLRQAVEVYKRKGLKEAFQILFYALGYYVELVELWTNNYITFSEQVPASERLYDPTLNPSGWFKAPYFGVRLTSLNQSIEISTGGEGQPWNFNPDDLKEILDAIHSIRPVNTVLYWINYYFDLVEKFEFTDLPLDGGISWEPNDEFFNCAPGDPIYLRDDRRLDGITRNGTDSLLVRHVRDPLPAICDPDLGIESELSDVEWIPEPWCTQQFRDAGMLYRDGYNTNLRDGSVTTRDPSAFGGRNGYYHKDTPLAPFDPDSENDLVFNRSGCYGPTIGTMTPLYQIAEEAEDGVIMYYNEHEFNSWLDRMTAGFGPQPDLKQSGIPREISRTASSVADPRSVYGNAMVEGDTDVFSLFGQLASAGNLHSRATRLSFSGLSIQSALSVQLLTSDGSANYAKGYRYGAAGHLTGKLFHAYGESADNGTNVIDGTVDTLVEIDISTLRATNYTLGGTPRKKTGYAQIGTKLFVVGGTDGSGAALNTVAVVDLLSRSLALEITLPKALVSPACVAINEFLYIFGGTSLGAGSDSLYRVNTITNVVETLPNAPFGGSAVFGLRHNNALYFFEATGNWTSLPSRDTYLSYSLINSSWSAATMSDVNTSLDLTSYALKQGRFYGSGASMSSTAASVVQIIDFLNN